MQTKAIAVLEVVVVFSLTLLLIAALGVSPIAEWERCVTNRPFLEYALMIAFPLLLLVVTRRDLSDYGMSLKNLKCHLDIAMTGFVPVAIASIPLAFLNHNQWDGALALAGTRIVLLFVLGWLLKGKPRSKGDLAGFALVWLASDLASKATLGNAISAFAFYVFFLGLGEELLFRGYIQSRLNAAFGKPFQFFGASWGWGVIITAMLFGFMHVLNLGGFVIGRWELTWWWGLWTFFSGLVFGFVREKTSSIIAPTLLHGMPQAIASALLGLP